MPRRAATVTQADVARVIRAVQAAGLCVHRIVVRPDGVAVETIPSQNASSAPSEAVEIANDDRVVVL